MYIEYDGEATVLFGDIVGFTALSSSCTAKQLVVLLNKIFGEFDKLAQKNHCEKIKVLGDCYYCVAGVLVPRSDHARCCVTMGLDMIDALEKHAKATGVNISMRVGVHTGGIISGVLGINKFQFDVWSRAVTTGNLLESSGVPGRVHISGTTLTHLDGVFNVEPRVFGQGERPDALQGLSTYLVVGHTDRAASQSTGHDDLRIAFDSMCDEGQPYITVDSFGRGTYAGDNRNHTSRLVAVDPTPQARQPVQQPFLTPW